MALSKIQGAQIETPVNISAVNLTGVTTAAQLNVGTGGTIITTTNAGLVGIGTTNPIGSLDVHILNPTAYTTTSSGNTLVLKNPILGGYAGIRFLSEAAAGGNIGDASINSFALSPGNSVLTFSTRGGATATEKVRITQDGALGIGTTNPENKLEVVDTASSLTYPISVTNLIDPSTGNGVGIDFHLTAGGNSRGEIGLIWGGNAAANGTGFVFKPNDGSTGNVERMRIDGPTGNVGIGTINASEFVHAQKNQDGATTKLRIHNEAGAYESGAGLRLSTPNGHWDLRASRNAYFSIQTADAKESFRIINSGNVGFGTTVPQTRVSVAGTVRVENISNSTQYLDISYQGLNFGSTGAGSSTGSTSNLLDDYEEGTWTPRFVFNGLSVSSYNIQEGYYTKIGNFVFCTCYLRFSGSNLSGSAVLASSPFLNRLPFPNDGNFQIVGRPAAMGRIELFWGTDNNSDYGDLYLYTTGSNHNMYFGVNKWPQNPDTRDFLYGWSEKSFDAIVGQAVNFELRTTFSYRTTT